MSTPLSSSAGLRLGHAVRERFLTQMGAAMQAVTSTVFDRLTVLMDEPALARESQIRRDVWMAYKPARSKWLEGTVEAWKDTLAAELQPKLTQSPLVALQLVAAEVAENKILASRLVMAVMDKVSPAFDDLRLRMQRLEGTDELAGTDLLRPDVLVQAMVEQWATSGMPLESWAMVHEVVQNPLIEHLKTAYESANTALVQQGVMPSIALHDRIRVPVRSSSGIAPQAASRPVQYSPAAADETRLMTSIAPLTRANNRAQGVMGQIRRLLAPHQAPSQGLVAALLPQVPVTYALGGTLYQDFSPAGLAQAADDLREKTNEIKAQAETTNEKATIEIVALMFQSILSEDRIPPGIRVWFARLQMPVLRVALEDADFLSTTTHPARLLIDRMGSCVMGFDATGVQSDAMETEVKRIVQVIEQYPETGKKVYRIVFDEFEKFLTKFLTESGPAHQVVSVAQQVEQKETLVIQYTIEMRNMLKDIPVRDEIRNFLFKVWAEAVAVVAVRKGSQHEDTLLLKKAATDLLWAASAKPNRADRTTVIKELPNLLFRLRSGMTMLAIDPLEQEAQIKSLSDTLSDAFLSKTQAIPQEKIDAMAERLGHLEDYISEDGMGDLPLDSESLEMLLGIEASAIDVVAHGGSKPTAAMLAWADELQVGSWFTLEWRGEFVPVQYAWRSERKHLNLFAATSGKSFLIQGGRLAAYLQAGLLLPHEEESLTVRATRDALSKLEANPERLLA